MDRTHTRIDDGLHSTVSSTASTARVRDEVEQVFPLSTSPATFRVETHLSSLFSFSSLLPFSRFVSLLLLTYSFTFSRPISPPLSSFPLSSLLVFFLSPLLSPGHFSSLVFSPFLSSLVSLPCTSLLSSIPSFRFSALFSHSTFLPFSLFFFLLSPLRSSPHLAYISPLFFSFYLPPSPLILSFLSSSLLFSPSSLSPFILHVSPLYSSFFPLTSPLATVLIAN